MRGGGSGGGGFAADLVRQLARVGCVVDEVP